MEKVLKVIKPIRIAFGSDDIYYISVGDELVRNTDGSYSHNVSSKNEQFYENQSHVTEFESSMKLDNEYIQDLIKSGYLAEDTPVQVKNECKCNYSKLYNKIDELLAQYAKDIENIDKDLKDYPECCKLEKRTVLLNLINLLTELKSYK